MHPPMTGMHNNIHTPHQKYCKNIKYISIKNYIKLILHYIVSKFDEFQEEKFVQIENKLILQTKQYKHIHTHTHTHTSFFRFLGDVFNIYT